MKPVPGAVLEEPVLALPLVNEDHYQDSDAAGTIEYNEMRVNLREMFDHVDVLYTGAFAICATANSSLIVDMTLEIVRFMVTWS